MFRTQVQKILWFSPQARYEQGYWNTVLRWGSLDFFHVYTGRSSLRHSLMARGGANESWGSGASNPIEIEQYFQLSSRLETKTCENFMFLESPKITLFQLRGGLAPTKKIKMTKNFFYLLRTCMNFDLSHRTPPESVWEPNGRRKRSKTPTSGQYFNNLVHIVR